MMKKKCLILALILELGAVCFLVLSMVTVFPEGKSNWYLPTGLGLNCIAMLLNLTAKKKRKRKDVQAK